MSDEHLTIEDPRIILPDYWTIEVKMDQILVHVFSGQGEKKRTLVFNATLTILEDTKP